MMETALVFDHEGKTIYLHEPPDRSAGALPDSRSLWEVLMENRERLGGVAHTHPWNGSAAPSSTDLSTFRAVELGLGKLLFWPIVTFTDVATVIWDEEKRRYVVINSSKLQIDLELLRARSR